MRFALDIDYPPEKMEQTQKRLAAWQKFRYLDRVPVQYCLVPRYFTPLFKVCYKDIFKDVETHYALRLQFAKYRLEHIPEDFCAGPWIGLTPYFDNAVSPSGHGGEIAWEDDSPPRAIPIIHSVEEMERFEVTPPETGLRGKSIAWWHKMKELAAANCRWTINHKRSWS